MQYNISTRKKDKGIQYIIQYKDETGAWKQKSKQGFAMVRDAKAAALEEVKQLEKKIKLQAQLNKEYEGKTFKEFREMYIKHIKLHREGNTVKSYIASFNAFSVLDDKFMREIESADIQEIIDKMIKNGLNCSTIKIYSSRVCTAFSYAIKPLRMIPSNPVQDIDIPKEKMKNEKRALTKSQLSDLLLKIKNRTHYIISLLASKCGLRIGEIVGLTWDDIDEKKYIINVCQQWKGKAQILDDNDSDEFAYNFGSLKSKNSTRKVLIPHKNKYNNDDIDVMAELIKYRAEHPRNINNRVFNISNTASISNALIYTYRKAGYDISVHELRHTYGTLLVANGLDFKTIAELMGHDVKQTLGTYSHVTDEMMDHAKDVINNIF